MKRKNIDLTRKLRQNSTDVEQKLWAILRNRQLSRIKFRRQFAVDSYILDFYASEYKLGVEADGGQHYENEGRARDKIREENLSKYGIRILRFSDSDIVKNIEGVCETIERFIKNSPSPQSSPRRGEEVEV